MISIPYEKFTLSNGLDVVLHEDHSLPVVAVNIWYHVGSKNEEPGRTGFAHLFEHFMFEGSKHHNKSYFEPLQKVGAVVNGSTDPDRTNYWANIPPNYLELVLWLESDRMGFLLDALNQERFDLQREVVKNERRQSYENRPYGMVHETLQPALFPSPHPYSWTTIGSQKDLDEASVDDVKDFFRRFYSPSNASLAIAGDIDPDSVKKLVESYFADIPPGDSFNRVGRMDSDLKGQVSLTIRDRVQLPRLYLVWPTLPLFSEAQAPLDILAVVLGGGKTSRLYRSLVYDKQIARDARVFHHAQEIAGSLHVQVTANQGHSLDEIETVVWEELDRIRREPPTEQELSRAQTRIESDHVRQLEQFGGFGGRADQLNYYNTLAGDPGVINSDIDRYMATTAEDVQRQASSMLGDDYVRLSVLPERSLEAAAGEIDRSVMPVSTAPATFTPPVPRRRKLANGLGVMVIEKRTLPIVAIGLVVRSGATNDPSSRPGLTDMTASMLTEGTATRSSREIAEEIEALGSELGGTASREYVALWTETLTSQWPGALEIMADVATHPSFPPEELERVRKERLTDLSRIGDNPMTIAGRASRALLYGQGSAYGHPLSGTVESIEGMTRDELAGHYAAHCGPENATLIVVGDVSEDEVLSNAEKYFGEWASSGATNGVPTDAGVDTTTPTTIYLADKPGAAQSVVRAGFLTIPRHHPDYHVLNFVNYVFGGHHAGRLEMNLREDKGYCYGYRSSIDWLTGPSSLVAGGAVQTDVTKEALAETLKEFADIRDERPVGKQEFSDARDDLLRRLPSQFETHGQTIQQLTRIVVFDLPDSYFSEYVEQLEALSLDEVLRVAHERIDDAHLKILVVGDKSLVEPGLQELGLPVVPVDYEGRELS
jgi:zinc protease